MKVVSCLIFFVVLLTSSFAQSGFLQGIVTEEGTSQVLEGVNVIWTEDGNKIKSIATTNRRGYFLLKNIEAGEQQFQVQYLGYETFTRTISIKSNDTLTLGLQMKPSPLNLLTVEIIGGGDDKLRTIAGTATKISSKEIALIQPIGTQEILQYVPGINTSSDDGMGNSRLSVGIRGLNPRRSSRVLILEDGIPIQPAIYLYPNAYYNPPVERIDDIEVIKGSAAIQYGPQTMGGVINYITRKPHRDFGGTAQITGGENNYKSVFTSIGGWGTDKFHPELQLLYKSSDGYRENNEFVQYNATLKFNIIHNTKNTLYIKLNTNYEDLNATYTGLTEYSFRTNPRFNPKKYDNFEIFRTALDIIYTKEFNENLKSTTKAYLNYFDRKWWREKDVFVLADDYNPEGPVVPVAWYTQGNLIRVGNGKESYGNLRKFYIAGVERNYSYTHKLFGASSSFQVGTRIHFERFVDERKKGFTPDARDGVFYVTDSLGNIEILGQSQHYETMAWSIHAMEKITLWKTLNITPGARFEIFEQEQINLLAGSTYRDKTTAVILPGIGLNYGIKDYNLFAGVHRGFTPPSTGTLNILDFGVDLPDGLDLRAEKSWNYELGIRGNTKPVSFEVAAFHLQIKDLVAAGTGPSFKNLGEATTSGIENNLHLHLSKLNEKLKYVPDVHLSYTYLLTNIVDAIIPSSQVAGDVNIAGNELTYSPRHTLTTGISQHLGFGLDWRIDYNYVSKVFTDFENIKTIKNRGDQGMVPSYSLINASVAYTFNKHWKVFATGKNLLDTIYMGSRLHSNPSQPEAHLSSGIMPGTRRQINLGVKYIFGK